VADAVQVAHPARFRLAGVGEAGGQIASDLGLRRDCLGLGVAMPGCDRPRISASENSSRDKANGTCRPAR
jgi:hypothetical protein